ncbi:MAG: AAA family ATPase [Planctomycetaceae bacterium]|jgi:AAA+ superfamily predicted ATPase|nr:AAA family ATPase [Planctomycetaceae bacterium]
MSQPSKLPPILKPITQTKPDATGKKTDAPEKNYKKTQEYELDVLIRARYPIVYIETWEEERVEKILLEIAKKREKDFYVWTVTDGIVRGDIAGPRQHGKSNKTSDPIAALDTIIDHQQPAIYIFKDFHRFTEENRNNLTIIRKLRDVAHHFRDSYKTLVIVAPTTRIAAELSKDVTVMQFALPTTDDFSRLLDRITDDMKDNPRIKINLPQADRDRLLNAARGLTLKEAENVFAKTLVLNGHLNAADISLIFGEKQQIIRKSGLLEYYETQETIAHVAGLENLKEWLVKRTIAFTSEAVKFGLPAPRGALLLGVQGCGKSLCAKAVSAMWEQPLLRFDIGRLFSGLVGSSEENVRSAITIAESVAPAVLWIDEIDKALSGTTGGSGDGGTSARVFGTLLTWLSEKTAPVFVIATANNISNLPPELLRKGRFDEIFFIDLPNKRERVEIIRIHLSKRQWDPDEFDLDMLAEISKGFSGAELEEAVISSLFDAFSEKKSLTTEILAQAIKETVPLSKTMEEELIRLRSWAFGRARMASESIGREGDEFRRKLEIE